MGMNNQPSQGHFIFDAADVIDSFRDSGYKNAAYAVGELIDNSLQAGAKNVELMCRERMDLTSQRARWLLKEVAILDDGSGMDKDTLTLSLRFGGGSYKNDRSGMGRFGMGLPQASVSQCTKVEIYSWVSSGKTLYTYLDVDEIRSGSMVEVPEPKEKKIPQMWRESAEHIGETGTLVIWSNLDRCNWTTANGLIRNSEELIGRMYRNFIRPEFTTDADILLSHFRDSNTEAETKESARPNDPIYLAPNSSTPDPWSKDPMFEEWGGDGWEETIKVNFRGNDHEIKLRRTVPKPASRTGSGDAGGKPHGQHARRNTGISLIRANREITLDTGLINVSDERSRWLGLEVEFPTALDEVFGLTNNKQSAVIFEELAQTDPLELAQRLGFRTVAQLLHDLEQSGDPRFPILKLHERIRSSISAMGTEIRNQTKGSRGGKTRHATDNSAEGIATDGTSRRKKDGHRGQSDDDEEQLTLSEKQAILIDYFEERGHTKENATQIALFHLNEDGPSKYIFDSEELEGPAFFQVSLKAGEIVVILNRRHPAFRHLMEALDTSWKDEPEKKYDSTDDEIEDLRTRLENASVGLKLLLAAWARYEDEQHGQSLEAKEVAENVRYDWGLISRAFLRGMG